MDQFVTVFRSQVIPLFSNEPPTVLLVLKEPLLLKITFDWNVVSNWFTSNPYQNGAELISTIVRACVGMYVCVGMELPSVRVSLN